MQQNVNNFITEGGNPSILTLGANYFINDNVKFTVDWGINFADALDLFAAPSSDTGWESRMAAVSGSFVPSSSCLRASDLSTS